jgi:uncharacterized delta-60 repeat protein
MYHHPQTIWVIVLSIAMYILMPSASNSPIQIQAGPPVPTAVSGPVLALPRKVHALAPLSGGRLLVAGEFISMNSQRGPGVAILLADGSLDSSFSLDSRLRVQRINAVAVLPDGKFLIGGKATYQPEGSTRIYEHLFRLTASGAVDLTFNSPWIDYVNAEGHGLNGEVRALLWDGSRIVVGGAFNNPHNYITRLNSDGSYDTTFTPGTAANHYVTSLARQSSGKLIIGGLFSTYNSIAAPHAARLNSNGTLDASFTPAVGIDSEVHTVAVLPNDTILLGGQEEVCDSSALFQRYNASGTLITTPMESNPDTYFESVDSILALPSGGFLVGGWDSFLCINYWPTSHQAQAYAYSSTGQYINMISFGDESDLLAMARRSDGRIALGGWDNVLQPGDYNGLALLDPSNSYNQVDSFKPIPGGQAVVNDLALQADGKLLVGGDFYRVNGALRQDIARLTSAGALDSTFTFTPPEPVLNSTVKTVQPLPDGKILLGGYRQELTLLNADGSPGGAVPATFNGMDITALALQPADNKILVGSSFDSPGLYRLEANALAVDPTFIVGTGMGGRMVSRANDIVVQPDQKIIVAGYFTTWNGDGFRNLVRLNANGAADPTFIPALFGEEYDNDELHAIALYPDGKILVGGFFDTVNGSARPGLARLLSNGALDTTFPALPVTNDSPTVYALALQPDGTIWVGGDFTYTTGDTTYAGLLRLNADGTLDSTFSATYQAGWEPAQVRRIVTNTDGLLWVGGLFSQINARSFFSLARYANITDYIWLPFTVR